MIIRGPCGTPEDSIFQIPGLVPVDYDSGYISFQKFDMNLLHFTQVLLRSARTSSGSSVTQCMWYLKGVIPSEKILLLLMEVSICDTHTIMTDAM